MRGDNIKRENSRLKRILGKTSYQLRQERAKVERLKRKLQEQRNLVDEFEKLWRAEMRTNRQLVERLSAQQDPVDKAIERLHAAAVSLREQSAKERQLILQQLGINGQD